MIIQPGQNLGALSGKLVPAPQAGVLVKDDDAGRSCLIEDPHDFAPRSAGFALDIQENIAALLVEFLGPVGPMGKRRHLGEYLVIGARSSGRFIWIWFHAGVSLWSCDRSECRCPGFRCGKPLRAGSAGRQSATAGLVLMQFACEWVRFRAGVELVESLRRMEAVRSGQAISSSAAGGSGG